MPKTFLKSKTIWFGAGQIAFGLLGLVYGMSQDQALSLVTTGIGTIYFRFVTSTPIA